MTQGRKLKRTHSEGPGQKKLQSKTSGSSNLSDGIETHFRDVMEDAVYEWIDPHACIPFTRTRTIVPSGVRRLMSLFDGQLMGQSINGGGITCGSDTAIVVHLNGTMLKYVYDHFKEQNLSEDEVKQRVEARSCWYGIVDGEHSHMAIIKLIDTYERWVGYKWHVTVLKSGKSMERYKQLARCQNERHENRYYVEVTFFDMISNMRYEYERLSMSQKRVTGQHVVDAYLGYSMTSKKTSTLIQTANTVIRLTKSVIETIGRISNDEHPELALGNLKLNKFGSKTVDEIMQQIDCRIFRNFIHITSLKSAKTFMNAKHQYGERAQVYSLYRAKDIYQQRNFSKAVQPDEITRQYELSIYAIEEESKFLKYIHPDPWPTEMNVLRQNLLQTTQLNDEIQCNHGNKEVLRSLIKAYRRHFPTRYIIKESNLKLVEATENAKADSTNQETTWKSSEKAKSSSIIEPTHESAPPTAPDSTIDTGDSPKLNNQDKVENKNEEDDETALKEKGINCYNMTWQEFMSEVWKEGDKRFDAIITNPPDAPSRSFNSSNQKNNQNNTEVSELKSEELQELARQSKKLLKPGGYFILLIEFPMFAEWYTALSSNGFNVKRSPMIFVYDPETTPSRNSVDFPHSVEEFCIVARVPGLHPDGFNPDFDSSFHNIKCNWKRRTSVITNVEMPKNRLCHPGTRKPFRMSEKSVDLLIEIIDLFVPPYGTAIDVYAGTLTLPIAALKTSRRCAAIEKDRICYSAALSRVQQLSKPVFKFVQNREALQRINPIEGGDVDKMIDDNESQKDSSNNNSNLTDKNAVTQIKPDHIDSSNVSTQTSTGVFAISSIEETSRDYTDMNPSSNDILDHEEKKQNQCPANIGNSVRRRQKPNVSAPELSACTSLLFLQNIKKNC